MPKIDPSIHNTANKSASFRRAWRLSRDHFRTNPKQGAARVRDIAKAKKVQMSSVTSALKRLDREGLITYEAREFARWPHTVKSLAKNLLKRHYFLTAFLVDVLKVDPKTAAKDACSMEHALSQKTIAAYTTFRNFLIPAKTGQRYLKTFHGSNRKSI